MSRASEQREGEFHGRFQDRNSQGLGTVQHRSSGSKDLASLDKGKSQVPVSKHFRSVDSNMGAIGVDDFKVQA